VEAARLSIGGGRVDLTDEQWARVFDAAYREAVRRVGDPTAAEDLAALAVERMLGAGADVPADGLEAYARRVVLNLVIDLDRKHRRRQSAQPAEDEDLDLGRGVFGLALHGKDPLAKVLKSERVQRRLDLASRVLESLNPRERAVMEMWLANATAAEIAEELGYASPEVVRVTLHRIRRRLGAEFAGDFTPSLFSTGDY